LKSCQILFVPFVMKNSQGINCYKFDCQHQFCHSCLEEYLKINIGEGKVIDINCPNPTCSYKLQPYDVHNLVDEENYSKYEEFTFLIALRSDPNTRWCPKPSCGNAVIGDPAHPKITCTKCSYSFCFNCNEDWHSGTCEDLQKWKKENGRVDQEFQNWARDKTKPCPGHRCVLGECLEPRSVCNGIADCVDGSDERNCTWS